MPSIIIDKKPYEVKEGDNLLSAVLSAGLDLPYFCWHPALGSIGACRQCAVQHLKDENDENGRMVMACMTPVTPGMHVSLKHPNCEKFRKRVIEWMMQNHPHDCPVCDEGGECHLQDMTVMTGHNYRRYRFRKRTFYNQNLGPLIHHEMNRCITCYRCVRYYQDVAGGTDLAAFSSSNNVYFGREHDGTLENEFSGNLVEICPTGVFTDKPFRKTYTRKWDLQTAPSVCQLCSVGCNITPGERYGTIRRVQNRFNPQINNYFLCDRGRFGHAFINSKDRLQPSTSAITRLDKKKKIMGIGSPRASLETNFALLNSVGPENFYMGMPRRHADCAHKILKIIKDGPARSASLADITNADLVFVLGEDITNTAPMLALAVRQSVITNAEHLAQKSGIPPWHDQAVRCSDQLAPTAIILASTFSTKLDAIAHINFISDPESLAQLGFAIAHIINPAAAPPALLSEEVKIQAQAIASLLSEAKNPVIISGPSLQSQEIIESAANIAWALVSKDIKAQICLSQEESNSLGLALLSTKNLDDALSSLKKHEYDTCVIAELDLSRRLSLEDFSDFLAHTPELIILDSFEHLTTQQAQKTLPVAAFSETTGTLINYEGRAQRFYKVFAPQHACPDAWRSIGELFDQEFKTLDDLTRMMCARIPALKAWGAHAYHANFRLEHQKIPRETREFSGRTAMNAHISIHEAAPVRDPDTPLAHSMEGFHGQPPAELTTFFWAPGWNSNQALNKYQHPVGGEYKHDHLGIRLFEPHSKKLPSFFTYNLVLPVANKLESNKSYKIIPHLSIFGSEERSSLSPALCARLPQSYVGLSAQDAGELNLGNNQHLKLKLGDEDIILPVHIRQELSPGYILVPVGLRNITANLILPKTCTISACEAVS